MRSKDRQRIASYMRMQEPRDPLQLGMLHSSPALGLSCRTLVPNRGRSSQKFFSLGGGQTLNRYRRQNIFLRSRAAKDPKVYKPIATRQ
ncbi:hypothetical protein BDDG_12081 [Blastomyces dermatitidis ATCC 18188]|uniref:Uncharacterized protein n=1 Tax=Ajellomyces dermatitidis (strain ATCC 18188 / CBS 674.68) TaxID=653446 RepID=A0A0J9EMR2_AJEDA|nr:hypothetical protein BDDG_12081 [Blastomyces dermatitidis ATCC 18188]